LHRFCRARRADRCLSHVEGAAQTYGRRLWEKMGLFGTFWRGSVPSSRCPATKTFGDGGVAVARRKLLMNGLLQRQAGSFQELSSHKNRAIESPLGGPEIHHEFPFLSRVICNTSAVVARATRNGMITALRTWSNVSIMTDFPAWHGIHTARPRRYGRREKWDQSDGFRR
jgi:hypothetical protein